MLVDGRAVGACKKKALEVHHVEQELDIVGRADRVHEEQKVGELVVPFAIAATDATCAEHELTQRTIQLRLALVQAEIRF